MAIQLLTSYNSRWLITRKNLMIIEIMKFACCQNLLMCPIKLWKELFCAFWLQWMNFWNYGKLEWGFWNLSKTYWYIATPQVLAYKVQYTQFKHWINWRFLLCSLTINSNSHKLKCVGGLMAEDAVMLLRGFYEQGNPSGESLCIRISIFCETIARCRV